MEINSTLAVSASALRAERMRLDTIASNLANANTTRTPEGGPYKRRSVVFEAETFDSPFADTLATLGDEARPQGVAVTDVIEDPTPPRMVYEPGHPDANAEGYVAYPNVNAMLEVVDLMAATRAYEANVQVIAATKRLAEAALSIGA